MIMGCFWVILIKVLSKKRMRMKKMIVVIVAIIVIGFAGFMLMRNRFDMKMFSSSFATQSDLMIVNDSDDDISVEYNSGDKKIAKVIKPNEKATDGKGFIRIFIAKKPGSYELTYPFPRPSGSSQQISLSQIIAAAQQKNLGDAVYTEKGMLGDIKVYYEEVRELDATY